MAAQERTN